MHCARAAEIDLASVQVIIPTRNEEATIAQVIENLLRQGLSRIRVVDNGSSDRSAEVARNAGAEVVIEPRPGYGRACSTGLGNLPPDIEWILFCDADGSDVLEELPRFFQAGAKADFVLGNRRSTAEGRQAMTAAQDFGNAFATNLLRLGWGKTFEDLGPLRLIRRDALNKIQMEDRGFGWTVEMQARAVEEGLVIDEIPVRYKERQGGKSKISGTVNGSVKAGVVILGTLGKFYLRNLDRLLTRPRCRQLALVLSALLLIAGSLIMKPAGDFRHVGTVPVFLMGAGVMGLGFLVSLTLKKVSWPAFWSVAVVTRLILLPMYPGDDVWRYLWEGWIQHYGYSPYLLPPLSPELDHLRTSWWQSINHPEVTTAYPPLAQLGFKLMTGSQPSVLILKLGILVADIGCCAVLQRAFKTTAATLYAWNPLVIYCFAGGCHYDAWFIFAMVAGWLLLSRKADRAAFIGGSLLMGTSVALKYVSLPLAIHQALETYRRSGLPKALTFCLLAAVPFAISLLMFTHNVTSLVPGKFVNIARSSDFIPYWIGLVLPSTTRMNWIYGVAVGMLLPLLLFARKRFHQFAEAYFFVLLVLSPIVHAWYFTWLTPFMVKSRNPGIILVSLSGFLYYWLQHRQFAYGDWNQSVPLKLLLWLPLITGFIWHLRQLLKGGFQNERLTLEIRKAGKQETPVTSS